MIDLGGGAHVHQLAGYSFGLGCGLGGSSFGFGGAGVGLGCATFCGFQFCSQDGGGLLGLLTASALGFQNTPDGHQIGFKAGHGFKTKLCLGQFGAGQLGPGALAHRFIACHCQVRFKLTGTAPVCCHIGPQRLNRFCLGIVFNHLALVLGCQISGFLLLLCQLGFKRGACGGKFVVHELQKYALKGRGQYQGGADLALLAGLPATQQLIDRAHAAGVAKTLTDGPGCGLDALSLHGIGHSADLLKCDGGFTAHDSLQIGTIRYYINVMIRYVMNYRGVTN